VKNREEGQSSGMFCKRKGNGWITSWMKRKALYTSGVVGSETNHMGYVKQSRMFEKMSTCLKQRLDV